MGCHSLIQGIFLTQGLNPGLLHCRWILYHLSYQGSPKIINSKWSEVKVTQSCPTLCNPMDCSLAGSSVHGILQARILEWEAYPFFSKSSPPRNWTRVSCIAGRFFTSWSTREIGVGYFTAVTMEKCSLIQSLVLLSKQVGNRRTLWISSLAFEKQSL